MKITRIIGHNPQYNKNKTIGIKRDGKRKSKKDISHKHEYKGVLIKSHEKDGIASYYYGEKCVICNKISNCILTETVPTEIPGYHRILSPEEIKNKYSHLEIIER